MQRKKIVEIDGQPTVVFEPVAETEVERVARSEKSARSVAISLRHTRNQLLALSDWSQMPDSPLPATKKEQMAKYRQALRDLPKQAGWPMEVKIPHSPMAGPVTAKGVSKGNKNG